MTIDDSWDNDLLDNYNLEDNIPGVDSNISEKRRPADEAAYIASKSLKGVGKGFLHQTQSIVSRSMPNTTLAYRDMKDLGSGAKSLYDDFKRDASKSVDTFKLAGRKLLPSVKKLIPQGIYDKLDKSLVPESTGAKNRKNQVEEDRENVISSAIEETFRQTQKIQSAERNEERIGKSIDRQLSITKFTKSQRALNFITTFMGTSFTAYMKKSIELKYKHLFVTQDMLATSRFTAQLLEQKLEEIKHNTSLPDIDKSTKLEELKMRMFRRMADNIGGHLSGYGGKILTNIKTNVIDKAIGGITTAAEMADMGADLVNMRKDMGDMDGPQIDERVQAAGAVGGMAGDIGGNWLAKKFAEHPHIKRIVQAIAPFVRDSESIFANHQTKTALKMNQWKNENEYEGGLKGFAASVIPEIETGVRTSNALETEGGKRALFDNITRTSIVEIIPGWLSKISKGINSIFAGKEQEEEEVYDFTKRDFVGLRSFKNSMSEYLHGSNDSRSRRMGAAVGTVNTFYNSNPETVDSKITDKINKGIERVIVNHATHVEGLIPKYIKQCANGGSSWLDENFDWKKEIAYENYIQAVFKGVDDKEAVAMALTKALYNGDTLNVQAAEAITKSIIEEMNASKFRGKYEYLFDTQGLSRFFKEDTGNYGKVDLNKVVDNKLKGLDEDHYSRGFHNSQIDILKGSITKSKENRNTLSEMESSERKIPYADKIKDYLQKGVIDEESASKLLASVQEAYYQSVGTKKEPKKQKEFRGVKSNINIRPTEDRSNQIDYTSILNDISTTTSKFHEDFLGSLSKETLDRIETPIIDRDKDLLDAVNNLKDSIIPVMTERKDVDYTTLDYIIRIHDKIRSGEKATTDDRRMFTHLSKSNLEDKGNNFISWVKRKWKKTPDATGGVHDRDATKEEKSEGKSGKAGGIGEGISSFIGSLTSGGGGAGKKILTTALPFMLFGPMGGLFFHDAIRGFKGTKALANIGLGAAGAGLGAAGSILKAPGKLFDKAKGVFAKVAPKFFDIHRKDKLDVGNPLLSAKKQEDGVFFADGVQISESKDIDKPVFNSDKEILITEDDLKAGLVNSDGMPINIIKSAKKGLFSFGKKAKSKGEELTEKLKSGELKDKAKAEYEKLLASAKQKMEDTKGTPEYARAKAKYDELKSQAKEKIDKGKKYAGDKYEEVKKAGPGLGDVKIGGISLKTLGIGAAFMANPLLGLLALGAGSQKVRGGVTGVLGKLNPFKKKDEEGEDSDSIIKGSLKRKAKSYALKQDQFKGIIKRLDQIITNTKAKANRFDDSDGDGVRDGSYADRLKKKVNPFKNKSAGVVSNAKNRLAGNAGMRDPDGTESHNNPDEGGDGLMAGIGGGAMMLAGGKGVKYAGKGIKYGLTAGRAMMGMGGATALGGGATAAANAAALEAVALGGSALTAGGTAGTVGAGLLAAETAGVAGTGALAAGATTAGVTAGGVATGIGTAVAGVLLSPAFLIGLGIVGTAAIGYGIYKYLKPSKGGDELLAERIKLYGIPGNVDPDYVRRLERRIYDFTIGEEGALTDKEINAYMGRFNLRSQSEASKGQFLDWLGHRFIPMFRGFIEALNATGKKFDEIDKIDNEDPDYPKVKRTMISMMKGVTLSGIDFKEIGKNDSALEKDDKAFSSGPSPISDAGDKVNKNSENIEKKTGPNLGPNESKNAVSTANLNNYNLDPTGNLLDTLEKHSVNQIFAINEVRDELIKMRKIMEEGGGMGGPKDNKSAFDKLKEFLTGSSTTATAAAPAPTGTKSDVTPAVVNSGKTFTAPKALETLAPGKRDVGYEVTYDDAGRPVGKKKVSVDEIMKPKPPSQKPKVTHDSTEKNKIVGLANSLGKLVADSRGSAPRHNVPVSMSKPGAPRG